MSDKDSAAAQPSPAPPQPPGGAPPPAHSPAGSSDPGPLRLKIAVLVYYAAVLVGSGLVATRPGMLFPAATSEPSPGTQNPAAQGTPPIASADPAGPSTAVRGDAASVKRVGLTGKPPPVTPAPVAQVPASHDPQGAPTSAAGAQAAHGGNGPPSRPTAGERLFILVVLAGAVGGILHGLTSIAAHAGAGRLSTSWWVFYVARPMVGGGLALVLALVLRSGILGVAVPEGEAGERVLLAWGALAGLFSSPALKKLKDVFDGLWSQDKPEDKPKPGSGPAGGKGDGKGPQPGPAAGEGAGR